MSIALIPLTENVLLKLSNDGEGWRFAEWVGTDASYLPPPTEEDRRLKFFDTEAAVAYLRRVYAGRLREPRSART
jgi:hypothetical protein